MDVKKLLEKYKDELTVIGKAKMPKNMPWPPMPIRNTPITARDNYLQMARGEKPMFMPVDLDEMMFSPKIFPDAIARGFIVDNNEQKIEELGGKDMFGVEWIYMPETGGSMVRPGNPVVTDITKWEEVVTFPDISKWDWEGSGKLNADLMSKDFAQNIWIMNGIFERLISLMDFGAAAVALIDEDQQASVHGFFEKLVSLYEEMLDYIDHYYDIDVLYFHDDWGSQRAPFFSADTCREMIAPYLKRVVECAHSHNMLFNFHSCGCIAELVPVMIECGVDIWCGQPMNAFEKIYDAYGDRIRLGIYYEPPGVGAPLEEVVASCKNFIERYSKNGYGFPVIYAEEYSADFYDVMYALSREYYQNH